MERIGIAFSTRALLTPRRIVTLAQEAEERGFEVALMTESRNDGLACAEAAALATKKIKVGTGIANIYLRHPALLAVQCAAIDDLSEGRLVLGLGTGHPYLNEKSLGISMARPGTVTRECIEIVKRVVAGEPVTYQGAVFKINNFTLGFKPFRLKIPIYIAVLRPRMARLAGEISDGVLFNLMAPEYMRVKLLPEIELGAKKAGRDPKEVEIASLLPCFISKDRDAALQSAKTSIINYALMPFYNAMLVEGGFGREANAAVEAWSRGDKEGAFKAISEGMAGSLTIFGSPTESRRQLEKYRKAGMTLPILFPGAIGQDWEISMREALNLLGG